MENIIGFGILVFGAYLKYTSDSQLDDVKAWAALIGGTLYLLWNNAPLVTNFLKTKVKSGSEQIFKPKDFELYDTNCLVHLRDRCIENGSKEGVEVCGKLSSIMFNFKRVSEKDKLESK